MTRDFRSAIVDFERFQGPARQVFGHEISDGFLICGFGHLCEDDRLVIVALRTPDPHALRDTRRN
jgi:hypothetical protein